jgi:FkbM family methyltransferase
MTVMIINKLFFRFLLRINKILRWKLDEHLDLARYSSGHSILRDLFSADYRKKSYANWIKTIVGSATSQGFYFTDSTPPGLLREIFLLGIYNVDGFTPNNGQVVIDVGANYGDSAIWWSKKFGAKVIAFEPLSYVFTELERNIKLNAVDVVAYNIALGSGEEVYGNSVGGMLSTGGNLKINTERLDSYTFDRVDLLKIDVEGFEYEVLNGAEKTISKFKPRIIIETHSRDLRKICHRYLSDHGYSLKFEGRTISSDNKAMNRVTNLFYAP